MTSLLRFRDLKARRIVNSWPQLKRLQTLHGFPRGRMLSSNTRAWTEQEIDVWLDTRPRENTAPPRGFVRKRRAANLDEKVAE